MTYLIWQMLWILLLAIGLTALGTYTVVRQLGLATRGGGASPQEAAQKQHITSLQSRIDTLQRGRRDQEVRNQEMEQRLSRALSDLDAANRELEDHRGTFAALTGSHEAELDQLRQAQRATDVRLSAELGKAQALVEELRHDNERLGEELAREAGSNGAEAQISSLMAERDRAAVDHEDALRATQAALQEQDSIVQALRGTNERLEAELLQARQDQDASAVLAQRSRTDAEHQLELAEQRQGELARDIERLTRELEVARRDLEQAPPRHDAGADPAELHRAREDAAASHAEVARLTEELRSTRRSLSGLRESTQRTSEMAAALEASEQRRTDIEAELANLRARVHAPPRDDEAAMLLEPPATEEIAAVGPSAASDSLSMQDAIRARAYDIWVDQGQPSGKSNEIWLQAESDVAQSGEFKG